VPVFSNFPLIEVLGFHIFFWSNSDRVIQNFPSNVCIFLSTSVDAGCIFFLQNFWWLFFHEAYSEVLQQTYALCSTWHISRVRLSRVPVSCSITFGPLNAKLNPICHLLALLGAHSVLHVSRVRVKESQHNFFLHLRTWSEMQSVLCRCSEETVYSQQRHIMSGAVFVDWYSGIYSCIL
jgi:hypothetical protein